MKSSILQPDDFQIGMFITIYNIKEQPSNRNREEDEEMPGPIHAIMMMQGGGFPPSPPNPLEMLKGSVLRVDAINLPFIMVTIFENNIKPGTKPKTHSSPIDLREVYFMKLNQEYVNAYLGKNNVDKLLEDKSFNDVQNIMDIPNLLKLSNTLEMIMQKLSEEEKRRKNENT